MKHKLFNYKLLLLLVSCVGLWACDPKPNDSTPVQQARGVRDVVPANGLTPNGVNGNNYSNGIGSWGQIFSNYDNEFNNAVRALVSSTMDPSKLGHVDPRNGVFFQGYIQANTDGTISTSGSKLRIEIWDAFAQSGQYAQIPISFSSVRSGQVNGGQITLTFEDQYGSIVFQGVKNGNALTGQVIFNNYTYFDGSSQSRQGTLGDFSIPYCYLVTCN